MDKKTQSVKINVPPDELKVWKGKAQEDGRSLSSYIRRTMNAALGVNSFSTPYEVVDYEEPEDDESEQNRLYMERRGRISEMMNSLGSMAKECGGDRSKLMERRGQYVGLEVEFNDCVDRLVSRYSPDELIVSVEEEPEHKLTPALKSHVAKLKKTFDNLRAGPFKNNVEYITGIMTEHKEALHDGKQGKVYLDNIEFLDEFVANMVDNI